MQSFKKILFPFLTASQSPAIFSHIKTIRKTHDYHRPRIKSHPPLINQFDIVTSVLLTSLDGVCCSFLKLIGFCCTIRLPLTYLR